MRVAEGPVRPAPGPLLGPALAQPRRHRLGGDRGANVQGLDLGRSAATTGGPGQGIGGVTYGPDGFLAYGWAAQGGDVEPALWRSEDGRAWERIPAPDSMRTSWLRAVEAPGDGYLLTGLIDLFGSDDPPHAAIWASPDGRTWAVAEVGAGHQGDVEATQGMWSSMVKAVAAHSHDAVGSDEHVDTAVAVGLACPPDHIGDLWYASDACRALSWHSTDYLAWQMAEVPLDDVNAMSVATNGQRAVAGVSGRAEGPRKPAQSERSSEIVVSVDPGTWDIANAGPSGQPLALIATERGFGALVSTRPRGGSDREELVAWSMGRWHDLGH